MQGETISPFIFSLFINDFESDLLKSICKPIQLKGISLFLLMYADTFLLSESTEGLQNILDNLHVYCESWNIESDVNVTKAKVVVTSEKDRNYLKVTKGFVIINLSSL